MGLFSGCFTGCAYHFIFNVAFPRLFGTSRSFALAARQTAADMSVVFPFLYMPTFFFFDELCKHGTVRGIPARWQNEIGTSMKNYVSIWPATVFMVFTVVPV